MAEESTNEERQNDELLTLSEVSNRTGISMPTLQRYKRNHQDRIPSEGKGRRQRYPVEALEVFKELKKENIQKRGRPKGSTSKRKKSSARGRKASAASNGSGDGLLTLTEVGERTGISYPTLVRYVKLHGDRIPFEGEGRRRRYHPEAVEVFRQIRSESPRGRRASGGGGTAKASSGGRGSSNGNNAALLRRLDKLERSQEALTKEIRGLVKYLQKPMKATFSR
jgi:predicted DNA-binding transcriptional regulator AlpA